jgi:hypothetical protein
VFIAAAGLAVMASGVTRVGVALLGNIALGVGALSYADQFNIITVAGLDECPDVEVFVQRMRDALGSLVGSQLRSTTGAR